jgi:hypothetical protein
MNDPQDEKKYEFTFKVHVKGSIENDRFFAENLDTIKIECKETIEKELSDFGSINIEEL